MRKKCSFFIVFLLFIFVRTAIPCYAQSNFIELTDIKVRDSKNQTFIDIKTSQPVEFLYYNLKNPPRLIIDFVGTNIYSQEPEILIFEHSKIKEIKSIRYESADENLTVDSLVLKFQPNVAVRIRGEKDRISLEVKEHSVISKSNTSDNSKLIRAMLLSSRIAENKSKVSTGKRGADSGKTVDAYSPADDFIARQKAKSGYMPGSYTWLLYQASIKGKIEEFKQLDKIVLNSGTSSSQKPSFINQFEAGLIAKQKKESGLPFVHAGLNAFLFISLLLLVGYRVRMGLRAKAHQSQLPDVEEILSKARPSSYNLLKARNNSKNENKFIEKRKYARFDLPQLDEMIITLDIETEGFEKVKTRALDISLGGIKIEIDSRVKLPEVLELHLRLPQDYETSEVLARIEWVNPSDQDSCLYGLSFMMLHQDEEQKIKDFLKNHF
jgi:hypothetical protein